MRRKLRPSFFTMAPPPGSWTDPGEGLAQDGTASCPPLRGNRRDPAGRRAARPAGVLTIRAGDMHRAGHVFCRSANGVWLVEHVPARYIEFPG